jgi:hypothetical protein
MAISAGAPGLRAKTTSIAPAGPSIVNLASIASTSAPGRPD